MEKIEEKYIEKDYVGLNRHTPLPNRHTPVVKE